MAPNDLASERLSSGAVRTWKVLSVDDDESYRRSLAFALDGVTVLDRPVEFLEADSFTKAASLLANEPDVAVLLLDVVMETDDAGLRLVKAVREVLGNEAIRIVLLSGQLGLSPLFDVMHDYDVNDCWTKSELTSKRLTTLLSGCVRTYEHIKTVARAKRGLQVILESTNALFSSRSIEEMSSVILTEIGALLNVGPSGIVCVRHGNASGADDEARIVAGTGRFASLVGGAVAVLEDPAVADPIRTALRDRADQIGETYRVMVFTNSVDGSICAVYLGMPRLLSETEAEMLSVFASNIQNGLHNLSLVSRLDAMAYSDALLGIPNRNALVRALAMACQSTRSADLAFALVDVDNFSSLNAALGTAYGDKVLAAVARKLRRDMDGAFVSRIANDQFGVIGDRETVDSARIVSLFSPSYAAPSENEEDAHHNVSVSAVAMPVDGICVGPELSINHAGIALRDVKRRGIGGHGTVEAGAAMAASERFELLRSLRRAVITKEIQVAFQPQIDLQTGEVCGVETLARWTRPDDGRPVSPAVFIPLAEASGLILPMGDQLFSHACAAAPVIAEALGRPLRIAVNVSPLQLAQPAQFDRFWQIMATHGTAPSGIEIELTESSALEDSVAVRRNLERFHDAGMEIAIDDFGTGYSSLAMLRNLRFHRLKIDRAFITEIGQTADEVSIADMVVRLGQRLRKKVLAEGVETLEQAAWLRARGCGEIQGYLYARPMSLSDLTDWLSAWSPVATRRSLEQAMREMT